MDELERRWAGGGRPWAAGSTGDGERAGQPHRVQHRVEQAYFLWWGSRRRIISRSGGRSGSPSMKRRMLLTLRTWSYRPVRNMIETTIIPNKPRKPQDMGLGLHEESSDEPKKTSHPIHSQGLYDDVEIGAQPEPSPPSLGLPSPTPPLKSFSTLRKQEGWKHLLPGISVHERWGGGGRASTPPKKKKYAKEAWPGRKHRPAQGLL